MDTSRPVAGRYRDPSQRFEHRYWNGAEWTPHVITGGARGADFGDEPPPAPVVVAPATVPVRVADPASPTARVSRRESGSVSG